MGNKNANNNNNQSNQWTPVNSPYQESQYSYPSTYGQQQFSYIQPQTYAYTQTYSQYATPQTQYITVPFSTQYYYPAPQPTQTSIYIPQIPSTQAPIQQHPHAPSNYYIIQPQAQSTIPSTNQVLTQFQMPQLPAPSMIQAGCGRYHHLHQHHHPHHHTHKYLTSSSSNYTQVPSNQSSQSIQFYYSKYMHGAEASSMKPKCKKQLSQSNKIEQNLDETIEDITDQTDQVNHNNISKVINEKHMMSE
jgi:hypothetical protein